MHFSAQNTLFRGQNTEKNSLDPPFTTATHKESKVQIFTRLVEGVPNINYIIYTRAYITYRQTKFAS